MGSKAVFRAAAVAAVLLAVAAQGAPAGAATPAARQVVEPVTRPLPLNTVPSNTDTPAARLRPATLRTTRPSGGDRMTTVLRCADGVCAHVSTRTSVPERAPEPATPSKAD